MPFYSECLYVFFPHSSRVEFPSFCMSSSFPLALQPELHHQALCWVSVPPTIHCSSLCTLHEFHFLCSKFGLSKYRKPWLVLKTWPYSRQTFLVLLDTYHVRSYLSISAFSLHCWSRFIWSSVWNPDRFCWMKCDSWDVAWMQPQYSALKWDILAIWVTDAPVTHPSNSWAG